METIIYISIAAVICGVQSWNEIEEFGDVYKRQELGGFYNKRTYSIFFDREISFTVENDLTLSLIHIYVRMTFPVASMSIGCPMGAIPGWDKQRHIIGRDVYKRQIQRRT